MNSTGTCDYCKVKPAYDAQWVLKLTGGRTLSFCESRCREAWRGKNRKDYVFNPDYLNRRHAAVAAQRLIKK